MDIANQLLDQIRVDNLIDEQREIAEITGIEAYRDLVRHFSGEQIRIWSIARLTKRLRDDQICSEYDGHNTKQLARKYHLSDQTIWEITQRKRANNLTLPD